MIANTKKMIVKYSDEIMMGTSSLDPDMIETEILNDKFVKRMLKELRYQYIKGGKFVPTQYCDELCRRMQKVCDRLAKEEFNKCSKK
jgi:hypothetical protein